MSRYRPLCRVPAGVEVRLAIGLLIALQGAPPLNSCIPLFTSPGRPSITPTSLIRPSILSPFAVSLQHLQLKLRSMCPATLRHPRGVGCCTLSTIYSGELLWGVGHLRRIIRCEADGDADMQAWLMAGDISVEEGRPSCPHATSPQGANG